MDIIFVRLYAQNRYRSSTCRQSPAAGPLDSRLRHRLAPPHDSRVGDQLHSRTLLEPAPAGVYPRLLQGVAGDLYGRGARKARSQGPLSVRREPSFRGNGRHDARRQADRPLRRRPRGGQRPADAPRTAASAVDSGEQARFAEQRLRPEVRRGVRRRSADPDLPGGALLALHRGRGDRPAVENQLPEKGLRFAARDRAGVRRRTAVELLLPRGPAARDAGAEAQYRDALAARRNVFPKGPALPHFRGRPDSRLRAAALRRTP